MSGIGIVRALAPAKVNLRLEVLGLRADGFHEIRTWILALDLSDVIEARANARGEVALAVRGPQAGGDVPVDLENLAARAAAAAIEAGRRLGKVSASAGVDLLLEKEIPSQAGLGGASADAAAAWIATQAALGFQLPEEATQAALARLGSDCVFFARAAATGFALCEGRGEEVSPAHLPSHPWAVAVVTPATRCPTAEVYRALRDALRNSSRPSAPLASLPPDSFGAQASAARPLLCNRLEAAAIEAFPELASWRALLDRSGADHFRLSGSGSSFFGLFDREDEAREALEKIRRAAGSLGLAIRFQRVTRPAGRGVRLAPVA